MGLEPMIVSGVADDFLVAGNWRSLGIVSVERMSLHPMDFLADRVRRDRPVAVVLAFYARGHRPEDRSDDGVAGRYHGKRRIREQRVARTHRVNDFLHEAV